MKLLRTIRFDESDDHVFDVAAPGSEWAVSGGFVFSAFDEARITGKTKQAFSNGFLGLPSFGWSTFTAVAEIDESERDELAQLLATHFVNAYDAPDIEVALAAANDEIDFVTDLCGDALINTVFTVRRTFDEGGEIRESFRTIQPPADKPLHGRVWQMVDDDV